MEQNWPRSFWNQRQELPCGHRLFNNFITIDRLHKATSKAVVGILKKLFTLFGIPTTIISDGGPQFTASDFQIFTKKWGITHVRSSPHYPNANGKAESAVTIMKHLLLKCEKDGTCQFEALLEQRNTPRQDTGRSPTEMMFKRKHALCYQCWTRQNKRMTPDARGKRNPLRNTMTKERKIYRS